MKVVLAGTGNVSSILGLTARRAGHEILQVIGRDPGKAAALAGGLGAAWDSDFKRVDRQADICIVAVTDDALHGIGGWLHADQVPVVHTAGSVSLNVLQPCSSRYGVLYPLQTFRADAVRQPRIPFLVDGNSDDCLSTIRSFAESMSDMVCTAGDLQRRQLHLAAVMTSNFMNHLMALTADYCQEKGLDFGMLMPLLSETLERAGAHHPSQVQTGPAFRKDEHTIRTHLDMLDEYPEMKALYGVMTESIRRYHQ
jgi:predicted short-subunit dehydrogenase-like oxidoreductase (DUF2520 family)